jgi:pyruvate-formate lyase
MAETEARRARKRELQLIAEICRRVPANPARTFREALQSFWFIFLMINPSPTASAGRFDQYMYPFYQADAAAGRITDDGVLELLIERELFPDAFRSSLMENGIAAGKDLLSRTMPFENGAVLNPVGMINVADSMAAIKKLVYEDKKIAMGDLKRALDLDWKGYESLRKMCLEAPKYGNGDSYVDAIAADLYEFRAATANKLPTAFVGMHKVSAISITSHQPEGALTGATPDGRRAHEICADGTASPMRGRDTHGSTAVMRIALLIDQDPYQATLMNMKFHSSVLQSDEDLRKLSALIKTYLNRGGKHVQFNVVSGEMLRKAQQNPERYRDLVMRVAGYSAYFTQLNRGMQDEAIARTELSLAGMWKTCSCIADPVSGGRLTSICVYHGDLKSTPLGAIICSARKFLRKRCRKRNRYFSL